MSAEFQVAFKEAGNKQKDLVQYSKEFKARLDDLYGSSQAVLDMWDGPASETFREAFDLDYRQMYECYETVVEYCNTLGEILNTYTTAENNNVKIFG